MSTTDQQSTGQSRQREQGSGSNQRQQRRADSDHRGRKDEDEQETTSEQQDEQETKSEQQDEQETKAEQKDEQEEEKKSEEQEEENKKPDFMKKFAGALPLIFGLGFCVAFFVWVCLQMAGQTVGGPPLLLGIFGGAIIGIAAAGAAMGMSRLADKD